jgi:hypothetical protein
MNKSTKKIHIVKPHPDAIEMLRARQLGGPKIAHGFRPNPALNLQQGQGRTLVALQFKNCYLGHWADTDMTNIDRALSGALTDPNLNHVIQQYFPSPVTTHFLGSTLRGDSSLTPASNFDRDAVSRTLASMDLTGIDATNTVICFYLPPGVVLDTHSMRGVGDEKDDKDNSLQGLGGYHGSADLLGKEVLFAVAVYSQAMGRKINGIPFWPDSWKNVVATMYHELNEARTNPDVEKVNRTGDDKYLGWYSPAQGGGEIGDIPLNEAGSNLGLVLVEVPLVAGGTAPIQLMWSNEVSGPCGPY